MLYTGVFWAPRRAYRSLQPLSQGAWGSCVHCALCSALLPCRSGQPGRPAEAWRFPWASPAAAPSLLVSLPGLLTGKPSSFKSPSPRKELKPWAESWCVCVIPAQPPTARTPRGSLGSLSLYGDLFFGRKRAEAALCLRSVSLRA